MAYQLKTQIALTVSLLMLVLLAAVSWLTFTHFEREFHALTINHLSTAIEASGRDVDAILLQAGAVLQAVDRSIPRNLLRDEQSLQRDFRRFEAARLTFDDGLMLFAADGRLVAVGPQQVFYSQRNVSGEEFFQSVLASRQPLISKPFRSAAKDGNPVVLLAHPLLDSNGQVVAVLAGEIDLLGDNLLSRFLNRPVGSSGYLAVLDRGGTVVVCASHRMILSPGRELLPEKAIAAILRDGSGEVHNVAVRGTEMLIGFRPLATASWTIVGFYPESEMHEPIRRAYLYTLLALGLLSMASVLVVRRLSDRLTAPLLALAREVRRQLHPETPFTPPAAGQFAELGELSEAIRTLMTVLATQRKELGDQLFFLQNLIDTIPNPIFYKDAAFRYLGCNNAFEKYIGMSRNDLLGKSVFEIAPPELARVYQQADQDLWDRGTAQIYEASVKYADGSVHDVIFYKSIFSDIHGQPAGMLGVFLDITGRKQAEAALQKALIEAHAAREQVDNILRSAADGLVVTNRRNRVTHINRMATEMLGVAVEDVVGKSYVRLFRNPQVRRQVGSFLAVRDVAARQQDFLLDGDSYAEAHVVQARTTPLLDHDGKLAGQVTLLRDVTRERELDRLKSEFISTAAHEMRTPMSVIIGYAELLLAQEQFGTFTSGQQKEFLQEICRKAEALSRLVDDLFDVSRIEAGIPLSIERTTCDLNSIVAEVVQRFIACSPRHVFQLALASIPDIRVDADKLGQVFENLISNAVKYSPGGGVVAISSEQHGDRVRFAVYDEGIGMTPGQMSRIFDKFYRADSSDKAVSGLGLGLSIVKLIVESHDGNIWVESQRGKGTTVSFDLPLN